jgi:hypothetical protein
MAHNENALRDTKQQQETQLMDTMGQELSDEQLEQLAEGSCSWGANCNSGCK